MKPYGLVAAASTTSQTSMPIRSQRIASSLTSAMFTERKMFSSSLVSSADSGVETATTSSQTSLVELDGPAQALVGQPADDLGRVAQRVVGAARVDPLGREGEEEVAPGRQAGLLQQRGEALARGAGVGGRLEHHQLARLQHVGERRAGVDQRLQIRLAVGGQRRRHRHHDGVDLGQVGVARRRGEALRDRLQALVGDVLDVRGPLVERPDHAGVDVHAHHVVPRLREGDDQRQTHVPKPDYSDLHRRAV